LSGYANPLRGGAAWPLRFQTANGGAHRTLVTCDEHWSLAVARHGVHAENVAEATSV